MGAPDDLSPALDSAALQALVEGGATVEAAARKLWRHAAMCRVWPCFGVLWDRSPWWYLREWPGLYEARMALRWVRRGGLGARTSAGWRLVEGVAAADAAYGVEFRRLSEARK